MAYAAYLENTLLCRSDLAKAKGEDESREASHSALAVILVRWTTLQAACLQDADCPHVRARMKRMYKILTHVVLSLAPDFKTVAWHWWLLRVGQRRACRRTKHQRLSSILQARRVCEQAKVFDAWYSHTR